MLINSINWLIDCKKALTSRQPQSCTWQPSWPGGWWGLRGDGCLCRCICLPGLWQRLSEEDEIVAGCPMLSQACTFASLIKYRLSSRAGREGGGARKHNTTSKNGGNNSNHVDACVYPHHPPSFYLPVPKVADMTRHTPPRISAARADMPPSRLPWQLLLPSTSPPGRRREGGRSEVRWEPSREQNGRGYGFGAVFVCLIISGLFI